MYHLHAMWLRSWGYGEYRAKSRGGGVQVYGFKRLPLSDLHEKLDLSQIANSIEHSRWYHECFMREKRSMLCTITPRRSRSCQGGAEMKVVTQYRTRVIMRGTVGG